MSTGPPLSRLKTSSRHELSTAMSSPRATEASSGDVQGAIVDDFVYVVTAAAERDDDTLDLCVAQLQDGVGEALAGAVIRAGLASSNSPPVPVKAAPPSTSPSTAPTVATFKAPPPGFGPSPKSAAHPPSKNKMGASSSTIDPAPGPTSAEAFHSPHGRRGLCQGSATSAADLLDDGDS